MRAADFSRTPELPGKMSATSVPTLQVPRRSTAIVSRVTRIAAASDFVPDPPSSAAGTGAPASAADTPRTIETDRSAGRRVKRQEGRVGITRDEVRHIARLANLDFTDEEYDRFTQQLNAILQYVAQLDRLDTSAIEATSHMDIGAHPLREDRVQGAISREEALANAPEADRGLFKVPKVIG